MLLYKDLAVGCPTVIFLVKFLKFSGFLCHEDRIAVKSSFVNIGMSLFATLFCFSLTLALLMASLTFSLLKQTIMVRVTGQPCLSFWGPIDGSVQFACVQLDESNPFLSLKMSNTFVLVSSPWSVSEMPFILMFARLECSSSSQLRCAIRSSSDSIRSSFAISFSCSDLSVTCWSFNSAASSVGNSVFLDPGGTPEHTG